MDILQLKISLKGIKPAIWRQVLVTPESSFSQLHQTIQDIMGWRNTHLYKFEAFHRSIGDSFNDDLQADETKVGDLLKHVGDKISYTYDLGDNWVHEIRVEELLPRQEQLHYPVCLNGKRHAPPEDCGGRWGYEVFLEAFKHPEHPLHQKMADWAGHDFDPEAFSLDNVNEKLVLRRGA